MPNHLFRNGSVSGRGSGWFRLALLAVQIALIGGIPVSAFIAELRTDWSWTPAWERIYYVTVAAAMIGLGMLRLPEILEAVRAWRGLPEVRENDDEA